MDIVPITARNLHPDIAARFVVAPNEESFGDYSAGRYAWILRDRVPLPEPIPCPGAQGVWATSIDFDRQIAASYLAARVLA